MAHPQDCAEECDIWEGVRPKGKIHMTRIPISALSRWTDAECKKMLFKYRLIEIEHDVLRGMSPDATQKCRKAVRYAKDRNICPNESAFAMRVSRYVGKAKVCTSDDSPEPGELEYLNIGFLRHGGDIYITSVECNGGN
jgi:hypothetical protein